MKKQELISNLSPADRPRSADVVVIGGGPAGTAALWAIERAAPGTKTVLLEQSERLGAGSSLASLENYRTCWPALCLATQMKRSVEIFQNADDYLGEGAALSLSVKQRGYLFCGFNQEQSDTLKQDVEHLHSIGLHHIEFLNMGELAYRFPWLGEKVIAAKFDPVAGWLDSNALVYRYAQSAVSAQILLGVTEHQIIVESGKVVGVNTPAGRIATPNVLIAAGASARSVGRSAGVDLPIIVCPRQSFTTGWRHEQFPEDAPMLIGSSPFPHVRPEARSGAIFGWEYNWNDKRIYPNHNEIHDYLIDPIYPADRLKDARFPSLVLALMARQFGHQEGEGFGDSRYLRGSHNIGFYVFRDQSTSYRPGGEPYDSERAILDAYPGMDGLFLSVAHVGHGIMSSPAAGEIIASKILRQPLPDPIFAEFGIDVPWVAYDEGVL